QRQGDADLDGDHYQGIDAGVEEGPVKALSLEQFRVIVQADELGAFGIEESKGLKAEKKGVDDGADQKYGQGDDHRKGEQVAHEGIAEQARTPPPGGGFRPDGGWLRVQPPDLLSRKGMGGWPSHPSRAHFRCFCSSSRASLAGFFFKMADSAALLKASTRSFPFAPYW